MTDLCGLISPLPEKTHLRYDVRLNKNNMDQKTIKDANGNDLRNGDNAIVVKDLKVKGGGSSVIKKGTKVKNIRLEDDGEHVLGSGDGLKGISIKAEFLKKA